jgi:hypothetical protein
MNAETYLLTYRDAELNPDCARMTEPVFVQPSDELS